MAVSLTSQEVSDFYPNMKPALWNGSEWPSRVPRCSKKTSQLILNLHRNTKEQQSPTEAYFSGKVEDGESVHDTESAARRAPSVTTESRKPYLAGWENAVSMVRPQEGWEDDPLNWINAAEQSVRKSGGGGGHLWRGDAHLRESQRCQGGNIGAVAVAKKKKSAWVPRALRRGEATNNHRKQAGAAGSPGCSWPSPLWKGRGLFSHRKQRRSDSRIPGRRSTSSRSDATQTILLQRKSRGAVFTSPLFLLPCSVENQMLLAEETPFVYRKRRRNTAPQRGS